MPDTPPRIVGGYRLVRLLGAGTRADVYLGAGSNSSVALKVYRRGVDRTDIGRELDALGRAAFLPSPSRYCARLLDVATGEDGTPVAILERVQRGSASQLLRERESIELGEAVTLLAPLVATVAALHTIGVAHTRIGAASVHFGAAGEPVLLGFGYAQLFEPRASQAVLDAEPAAAADRDALATLCAFALSHVRGGDRDPRVAEFGSWIDGTAGRRASEFTGELENRLYDLADALPIEFGRPIASASTVPARLGGGVVEALETTSPPPSDLPAWIPGWLRDSILGSPVESVKARIVTSLRGVRKPVWIVVGAVAVALIAASALLPQGGPETPRPAATKIANAPPTPVALPSATPLPADPVLALPLLLAQRRACIDDRSTQCLDQVDEAASGAYESDATLVRSLQGGGQLPATADIDTTSPKLIEQLGDSALVSLGAKSDPASALMIKEEAGWRIRSFLSGKPAESTAGG
jgi:serine/threonine protein kinase